jgi:hypothetical protein
MKKSINLKSNTLCICFLILVLLCLLLYRNGRENFGVFGELGEDASENTSWQTHSQNNNAGAAAAAAAVAGTTAAESAGIASFCNNKKTEYQTQINELKNILQEVELREDLYKNFTFNPSGPSEDVQRAPSNSAFRGAQEELLCYLKENSALNDLLNGTCSTYLITAEEKRLIQGARDDASKGWNMGTKDC